MFSRRGIDKDERALAIERDEIERLAKDRDAERSILDRNFFASLQEQLLDQKVVSAQGGVKKGTKLTDKVLKTMAGRGRGRPADTDSKEDAKLHDNWKASDLTLQEFAERTNTSRNEVRKAVDRHRKRESRRQ